MALAWGWNTVGGLYSGFAYVGVNIHEDLHSEQKATYAMSSRKLGTSKNTNMGRFTLLSVPLCIRGQFLKFLGFH